MYRLNNRAFDILQAEVKNMTGNQGTGKVQREIILKRLEKLRLQKGEPANEQELQATLNDILPNFSQAVLKKAAVANKKKSNSSLGCLFGLLLFGGGMAGLVWLVNLPFPMIRKPVANVAPLLLLPSYIAMDNDYKQATALVEQADQLVNKATSGADIELGEQKVKKAQEHLNRLPVWFLGYEPKFYCSLFACSWRFTFDEFERARKNIGRMEAIVFQERNAQIKLSEAETALNTAKSQYQQAAAGEPQQKAITAWQTAIDQMRELPKETLAYQMVQPKLSAAERDFVQVVGDAAGRTNSNNLIEAAKQYALLAAQASQNPPHPAKQWEEIGSLWEEAIKQLKMVGVKESGYVDAQKKLAEYQKNLGTVRLRKQMEEESVKALQDAKQLIPYWQTMAGQEKANGGRLSAELQKIINELESVKTGTTAHKEAQELLKFARESQKQLQQN
ncbi:hypothetical protein NG798_24075 [Ancylothrix sp. C2]|uniref:hypothetical protein n=1 Tax=Ancylothrix sp. D3o TaxID=2953691 RepID=UPI0021BAD2F7|nr:hypothetical protein [Ancylothrix sp. D3o]MCT7952882.1 hypothetical protein [Ancylothrix sp. D3o]